METAIYIFQISPYDTSSILPQVSKALDKRTELVSRERYPGLWTQTDKLNAMSQGRTRSRLRTRVTSLIFLALGIFLFVPGLVKPQELLVPLIAGGIGIIAGICGLWRSRKHKKNPFDEAAKKLLAEKSDIQPGQYQVLFSAENMIIAERGKTEHIPYSKFECAVETADIFLLTFDERVTVLLKRDLSKGSIDDFVGFISEKVAKYQSIT